METGTETSDTKIAKEIVRCGGFERVYMALDYFDVSINWVSAWAIWAIRLTDTHLCRWRFPQQFCIDIPLSPSAGPHPDWS